MVTNYLTAPPPLPPFSTLFRRTLGVGYQEAVTISNDPRFLTGGVPAGNVVATANPELDDLFELLRRIALDCPSISS